MMKVRGSLVLIIRFPEDKDVESCWLSPDEHIIIPPKSWSSSRSLLSTSSLSVPLILGMLGLQIRFILYLS